MEVSKVDTVREARQWDGYIAAIGQTTLFPGIRELLEALKQFQVPWGVVTNIPRRPALAMLDHYRIDCPVLVAYQDVPRGQAKPSPAMCNTALARLARQANEAIGVGDRLVDARAFRAAEISGYCADWNAKAERVGMWDGHLSAPREVLAAIGLEAR